MLSARQHTRRSSLFVLVQTLSAMAWRSSGRSNAELVNNLAANAGIKSSALIAAMKLVDRANFVPREQLSSAYDDRPLPIGYDQTISAPHMHAYALDRLAPLLTKPDASILDVGAGSGYLLAVFAYMCPEGDIRGIEVVPGLVAQGNANLARQPVPDRSKIRYEVGDGWEGLPGHLFDAIHVGAAAEKVPEALVAQLKKPGRMIVPIGPESYAQQLVQVDKDEEGKVSVTPLLDVRYVPLIQPNADIDIPYVK